MIMFNEHIRHGGLSACGVSWSSLNASPRITISFSWYIDQFVFIIIIYSSLYLKLILHDFFHFTRKAVVVRAMKKDINERTFRDICTWTFT